jgi:hypothetical protein
MQEKYDVQTIHWPKEEGQTLIYDKIWFNSVVYYMYTYPTRLENLDHVNKCQYERMLPVTVVQ